MKTAFPMIRIRHLLGHSGYIVLVYAVIAGLWIVFSDAAVEQIARDPELAARLQTYKGLFYVLVTAGLLLLLIRRAERSLRERNEALRSSEERFRNVVEDQTEFIVRWLPDGTRTFVNESYCRYYGTTKEDAIGTSFFPLIHDEDRARVLSTIGRLTPENPVSTDEHRVIRPDGNEGWNRWTDRAIFGEDGELLEYQSVGRDVTAQKEAAGELRASEERLREEQRARLKEAERSRQALLGMLEDQKRTEEALRESNAQFSGIVQNSPLAIALVDAEGHAYLANPALEHLLGYSAEELAAMTFAAVTHPEDAETDMELYQELVAGHRDSYGMEKRYIHKDGSVIHARLHVAGIRDEDGNLTHIIGMAEDVTERREARQKLEAAFTEIQRLNEQINAENVYLREEIRMSHLQGDMTGDSEAMRSVMAEAQQVAVTDSTVLILGETGTGKELLARAVHNMSPRREKPLVIVNCAAMPAPLIESELFGREKGAYTGALTRQVGRFEAANGGTVLLDEIGELPLELQAKLLRVLQEGQFERLGSSETVSVDVRLIAATNRDLEELIRGGSFRQDLFFRLNVFPLTLPPLRDRREDIPALVWAFVNEFGEKMGKHVERISQPTMEALVNHPWPGNVRELRNVVERAMIGARGSTLKIRPPEQTAEEPALPEDATLDAVQRHHILAVLEQTGWRIRGDGGAARVLGINPTTLESRMGKLGIQRPERS